MPRCTASAEASGWVLVEMMIPKDIDDRRAIRNHVALKTPLAAQLILQQELADTGGLPVDARYRRTSPSRLPSVTVARNAGK